MKKSNGRLNELATVHVNKITHHRLPMSMKELKKCTFRLLDFFEIDNAEVSVTFINDDDIRKLNKKYRGSDSHTDVLAFELSEPGAEKLIADIYISMDRIIQQAKTYRVKRKEEILRLLVHGVLHVCGFRDNEQIRKEEMFTIQERLVKRFVEGG